MSEVSGGQRRHPASKVRAVPGRATQRPRPVAAGRNHLVPEARCGDPEEPPMPEARASGREERPKEGWLGGHKRA